MTRGEAVQQSRPEVFPRPIDRISASRFQTSVHGSRPCEPPAPDSRLQAEAAYRNWRSKAGDMLLVGVALGIMPQCVTWVVGYDALPPRFEWITLTVVVLLLGLAMLLFRRVSMAARVWLVLLIMYVVALQGLVWYSGAMARVWLAGAPVVALILGGSRAGLVASVMSAALITLHAVGAVNGVTASWRVPGFDETHPSVIVARSIMWLAFFVPLMTLLYKFYHLEMRTLAAERTTSARLGEEVVERRAAHEELARAAAERERLEREIARVGDEERRRLGQDLHDGVSQQLAAALLRCTALEARLTPECPDAASAARALGALVESTMDEVHEVATSLCPLHISRDALGPALAALARRASDNFGVRCDFREQAEVLLPETEQRLHLYRIAQEAVNNAGKHAAARRVAITLGAEDHSVLLTVEDDGRGLPRTPSSGGLGLRIMAYRAQTLGGTLALERLPQGGTRVVCRVPAARAHGQ